eukprot:326264-Prymnesium_polylepis.1
MPSPSSRPLQTASAAAAYLPLRSRRSARAMHEAQGLQSRLFGADPPPTPPWLGLIRSGEHREDPQGFRH